MNKLVLSVGAFLFAGSVTIVNIDDPCVFEDIPFFEPQVVIELPDSDLKQCFELEADYIGWRDYVLKVIKDQQEFIYEDAILMLSEEVKRGNVDVENLKTDEGVTQEINQLILDNNIVQFPKR